ncbi:MAG: DUF4197 domain-containing protein [Paludibacteraceae bacterium]|nr:DUF4197 domain-containing protein [Paludibacteraceae bacterium]MBR4713290.1 DUF4197 domain-containing protein [Paludibacteraceae bacterium]MBR5373892.1 DUF4197 domain-containing protein [Paludibacteraceae bacterium]
MGLLNDVFSTISKVAQSDAAKEIINSINGGGQIDIAAGLKAALKVGIETAATNLGKKDGFLADAAVRIGIPEEALSVFNAVQSLAQNPAFNSLLNSAGASIPSSDTVITLLNRAAEDAAPKSVDIFADAITGMGIADAKNILFGADNAATTYLKENTFTQLQDAFMPTINNSLGSVQIANTTPLAAWNTFATYNNKLVEMMDSKTVKAALEMARMTGILKDEYFEKLASIKTVNTDLSDYITGKALTGLFTKVSEKEYDIRHNASARVSDVLKNVFGQLDNR